MAIAIYPITPNLGAEVGVDLSRPLSAEDVTDIKQAFWQYAVLIFPDQNLTVEQLLEFFGIGAAGTSAGSAGDGAHDPRDRTQVALHRIAHRAHPRYAR